MSHRPSASILRVSLSLLIGCFAVSQASGVTITSNSFSLGFGATEFAATANPGAWSTLETNTANTPVTVGNANDAVVAIDTDFALTPAVRSQVFSNIGPVFVGRVLADGLGGGGGDRSGYSFDFEATLSAAYTGVLPIGATNVQTTLNITDISIYAVAFNAGTSRDFQIFEPGAGTSSPITAITASPATNVAVNYTQAVWDPADITALGTSATRNFNVTGFGNSATSAFYSLDGFEVEGNIVVTYDIVPEPSSFVLIGIAFAGFVKCTWRRSRRRLGATIAGW